MTKLGIYLDLRNPPGWRRAWTEHYDAALRWAEYGDATGIDSFWVTEHHLFEDGYLPQPLTFLAAAAARTKRIRLGTAVMLAPLRPSIQIAEEAAIVDIISHGRLDLGLGNGYRKPEYDAYGAPLQGRWDATDRIIREVRAWWEGGQMMPPMVQKQAPIWVGYQGPKGAYRAGRLGENLLSLYPHLLEPYLQGLREAGYDATRARMAGPLHGLLVDDPERAWPEISKHIEYQWNTYKRYGVEGTGKNFHPIDVETYRPFGPNGELPAFFVATPEQMGRAVRERLGGLPIDTIFMWADVAGLPHHYVERHLELLATKLPGELGDLRRMKRNPDAPPWQVRLISAKDRPNHAAAQE